MSVMTGRLSVPRLALRGRLARLLPAALLAGYALFILSLWVRHALTLYINPSYVLPTTAAGCILAALAATMAWRRTGGGACDTCGLEDCGCAAPSTNVAPYLLLAVPLVLAVLVPPRGLTSFSARQRGVQVAGLTAIRGAATVKRVSLSVDTRSFTLQDWVGALAADPNPKDYLGKPVLLKGIVIHSPASVPPGYIMVLRYQVTCCIADARPEGLAVKDTSHGALQDNQWVTVTGTMGQVSYQGENMAVVVPRSMTPTKAGDPYMY